MVGTGGSSRDKPGTVQHCRMGRVWGARREGIREEPVSEASSRMTSSNPVDVGWYAVRTLLPVVVGELLGGS